MSIVDVKRLKRGQVLQVLFLVQFFSAVFLAYHAISSLRIAALSHPGDAAGGFAVVVLAAFFSVVFTVLAIIGFIIARQLPRDDGWLPKA